MNRLFMYIKSYFVSYRIHKVSSIIKLTNTSYLGFYSIGYKGVYIHKIFESYKEAFIFPFEYHFSCGEVIKINHKKYKKLA